MKRYFKKIVNYNITILQRYTDYIDRFKHWMTTAM